MSEMSRRSFVSLATLASAAVPLVGWSRLAAADTAAPPVREKVLINYNENPLGPSPKAVAAMQRGAALSGRYHFEYQQQLIELFARQHGLPKDHVHAFCGSSEPLQYAVMAFTGPRSLVLANPSYEAAMVAAKAKGAPVHEVPLDASHAHDIPAMLAADSQAGLIYICNPNNPTGTVTARERIEFAIANRPKGSVVMIDEAYIHLSNEKSCLDLAAQHDDVLVLQTFSKLYGMAGARLGFAVGKPDLLAKLEVFGGENAIPVAAMLGGMASLEDRQLVAQRRKENAATRDETLAWLRQRGFACTASQGNCFMVDTGHPGQQVIAALARRNIVIGRTWPAWPTWVRVSVGLPNEMKAFREAFVAVLKDPTALAGFTPLERQGGQLAQLA
ncbi:pyridoxal phosphate-dependent aminotransferase [Pseudomonas sp. HR1]|uniref:Histidinol-phosphate aminotransferase n=1 Tax=Pseudomonas oryzihabitans TaxID=47885 RepID=A0A1G5MAX1_9PSED|nr:MULTISPECIES: pyridoxal phosphate-dependent aminotransferase [Pseudomonas]MDK4199408.1 pyridoxal phosphate-dependent aminotransferase [Pseudomonas sp. HR1]NMY88510.1 pyridoxal phosphate-dependent aminotransferase [Pseudomonas psychrotolerans]SCZ21931.1 histidinol-phosphate aminotransferase [Pseudomonas psychrotolerans]